jgi:hypothetical protein
LQLLEFMKGIGPYGIMFKALKKGVCERN